MTLEGWYYVVMIGAGLAWYFIGDYLAERRKRKLKE